MRWFFALALAGSVVGCGSGSRPGEARGTGPESVSDETTACIDAHPAGEPFDVGQADTSDDPQPTLETFQSQCRAAGGSGCDGAFISREAARCIAQNEKLEAGLEPWAIGMWYEQSYRRVGWEIQNVLVDQGSTYQGTTLTVDAVSGRVLGRSSWSTTQ
ncbi:MAG TPA: hypothetical protein VFS67_05790 [Polyangiaceae bacterium]|nr:hypothetical protein [Polyangiaceae bacterium]